MRFLSFICLIILAVFMACAPNRYEEEQDESLKQFPFMKDSLISNYKASVQNRLNNRTRIMLPDSFNFSEEYWVAAMLKKKIKHLWGFESYGFQTKNVIWCSQGDLQKKKHYLYDSIFYSESEKYMNLNLLYKYYDTLKLYADHVTAKLEETSIDSILSYVDEGFASVSDTLKQDSINFIILYAIDHTGKTDFKGLYGNKDPRLVYRAERIINNLPDWSVNKFKLLDDVLKIHTTVYGNFE